MVFHQEFLRPVESPRSGSGIGSFAGVHVKSKYLIFIVLPVLLMTATGCSGIYGTLAWRSWEEGGVRVTEVRSAGIEMRNLPGYRGSALGWRQTIYANRLPSADHTAPENAKWNYGWVPDPGEFPVHLTQTTYGLEGGWEPSFRGASFGISSRSVSILPADGDEILEVSLDTRRVRESRFSLKKTP